ncbi:phage portal protein [Paenibacillus sp. TRM 82003]|nr:phage portal protein [Paenibacillus sp. TRM 82003]
MEKRSWYQKIFKESERESYSESSQYTQFRMMDGYTPTFSLYNNNLYESDIVRSCVDAIARNGAKLKGKHIRRIDGKITNNTGSQIERLLTIQPNSYMNAYAFMYKVITQLYIKNNAFIFVDWDNMGQLQGLYPIDASTTELVHLKDDPKHELYCKFQFLSGVTKVLPYSDLIHLRRHFYKHDVFGDKNDIALKPIISLIDASNDSIINATKKSAYLRGWLKFTQSLRPEDLKKQKEEFVRDYLSVDNNGGVAATDTKMDFQESKSVPVMVDDKQMKLINDKVYNYFGVNEKIITSNYNEDEWDAFYESILEPLAIQMSLEFTNKLFTEREKGHGNEVLFEANRLAYASNKTKITLAEKLMPFGVFTVNEVREVFNLAPVEGGDKRLQTLNVVNANKADTYQEVEGGEKEDDGTTEDAES